MKKAIVILLFLSSYASIFAQEKPSTTDLKLGIGRASWNGGIIGTFRFEIEFTKKWNRFLSSSFAADFTNFRARESSPLTVRSVDASSISLNSFVSPFANDKKHNFKIGLGLSLLNYEDLRRLARTTDPSGGIFEVTISYKTRGSIGYNVILDYDYDLGKKCTIGARGILQQRSVVGSSLSYFLRFGIKL